MRSIFGIAPLVIGSLVGCLAAPLAQAATPLAAAFAQAWARQPAALAEGERQRAVSAQSAAADRWTPAPGSLELGLRSDRFNRNQGASEVDVGVAIPLWLPGERSGAQALAAAGVLGPLIAAGTRHITVANRTLAKAEALVTSHTALAALHKTELLALVPQALERDFDLVINATASSLAGDAVPVPAQVLHRGTLAYDMMYGPAAEGFLAWARTHGATPRDGLGMLVEQAAEAFLIWRGTRPPSTQVLAELRAQP